MLLLVSALPVHSQYVLQGTVTDSLSGKTLSFVSVRVKGNTFGVKTNAKGYYVLKTSQSSETVVFSAVGYKTLERQVSLSTLSNLDVSLSSTVIKLNEVVIKPRREHYKKKDNPAVLFVRQMIQHRDDHSPDMLAFWKRKRYDKVTFALNNFTADKQSKSIYKKFTFLKDYTDTSTVTRKPVLTVSIREMLGADYFRKSPHSEKQMVFARKQAGIDQFLSDQGMTAAVNEMYKDVNVFQNDIYLFTNKFVSPLSHIGPSFYKYYLMDTLDIEGERCVDLGFVPYNSQSFGFTGHLYVTLDSTYFVKKVVLNFPKKINLNFVDFMALDQTFTRAKDGIRLIDKENLTTIFKLKEDNDGIYSRREVTYSDYSFDQSDEDVAIFKHPERVIEERNTSNFSENYWEANRPVKINKKEDSVDRLMSQLRKNPVYYWTEKSLMILFTGYIPVPDRKAPLFYIGLLNSFISGNSLEGVRLHFGGMTTAWLNPHLFFKGYAAYGCRDHKLKEMGELEYSFKKKQAYANEFPIHSLKLHYEYDVNRYGQNYLYTSPDNVFLTLKRQTDNKIAYQKKAELTYTDEFYSGFSFKLTARNQVQEPSHFIPFIRHDEAGNASDIKYLTTSELELKLRYAPNEKFYQTQWDRFPVNLDAPVFSLSHIVSAKNILGGDYAYQRTEVGFQKRIWFSAFGYTDMILKAGKVWNKVPFPLLLIPNANLSYTIQPESYALMNALEFINDQYASWDVTYYLNGWLFNRIPLLKKLKWREIVSSRGLYGHLSDKNNPQKTTGLLDFPSTTSLMGDKPYVEVGVGIENIFKILRFDYVWRLTYKNLPNVDKRGLRVSIHMTF